MTPTVRRLKERIAALEDDCARLNEGWHLANHVVRVTTERAESAEAERDDYKRRWKELHDVAGENVRLREAIERGVNELNEICAIRIADASSSELVINVGGRLKAALIAAKGE